ncbi:MAG TPA: chloride channel protein [Dongiaceae bacterium]|jgi:CIC family chloride channel protein|nr:chloride channel protein [Dongiaceae bacterium]
MWKFLKLRLAKLRFLIGRQLHPRAPTENAFLIILPILGLIVGLISVATAHIITLLQTWCWGEAPDFLAGVEARPGPARIFIPVAGGLVVGLIGWVFKVRTRGGGINTIIQSVAMRGGFIPLRQSIPRDAAAIVTISTGGSLGREGAMALFASAVGSYLGRRIHLSTQQIRILVCAAAAGALASVYNAPIGGALFALEILIGNFALDVLGPVVVVSVISTLVFRSFMGSLPRFEIPQYELVSAWELGPYLLLGIVTGLVARLFVKVIFATQDFFEGLPVSRWLKPALGMLVLGILGWRWPEVYGNGFEAANRTLREQLPIALLAILIPVKMLASAVTFGSGGAGGLFTPSLLLGALVGGTFGFGVHFLFPSVTAEYGAYGLVGMGGLLAGMTHAPLMAIMMIFEQTNSYQIILPLMFVCIVSHFTVRLARGQSMESEALRRRGIVLPQGPEGSVMQTTRVFQVMHEDVEAVSASTPFSEVVERFLHSQRNWLYVVDTERRFLGAISLHAIKDILSDVESLRMVVAADLVTKDFEFVTPRDRLSDTMDKFYHQNSERLPVVDGTITRKLVGWISKRDLIGIYSQEILRKRQVMGHFVTSTNDERKDMFVELPEGFELRTVELPPQLAGRTLVDLSPRTLFSVHVIAIKRRDMFMGRDEIVMPDPKLSLNAGDRLVVIGRFEDIARFIGSMADKSGNAAASS